VRAAICYFGQDNKAAFTPHKCSASAGIACTFDQVALANAEQLAAQNLVGALIDGDHGFVAAAPVFAFCAGEAQLMGMTQHAYVFLANFPARQQIIHVV
jgi:hypothetical protein